MTRIILLLFYNNGLFSIKLPKKLKQITVEITLQVVNIPTLNLISESFEYGYG